jgi:secondary thiamine-phosphate synthase enzyme
MVSKLMVCESHTFQIRTKPGDFADITQRVAAQVSGGTIESGLACVFMPGSTGGITCVEYEPGLVTHDLESVLEAIAPNARDWAHHRTWGDHNGAGHIRSFLIKPEFTVPFTNKKLILGTWQQIVFCEFDERPRTREIHVQVVG